MAKPPPQTVKSRLEKAAELQAKAKELQQHAREALDRARNTAQVNANRRALARILGKKR